MQIHGSFHKSLPMDLTSISYNQSAAKTLNFLASFALAELRNYGLITFKQEKWIFCAIWRNSGQFKLTH